MLKNVTITLEEEDLRWVRRKAADQGLSLSKLLGQMIEHERHRRTSDAYWQAYERWKKISAQGLDIDAANRLTREEAHERRR